MYTAVGLGTLPTRMAKGLPQRQLARGLGVDPTTVMKWEAEMSKPVLKVHEQIEGVITLLPTEQ